MLVWSVEEHCLVSAAGVIGRRAAKLPVTDLIKTAAVRRSCHKIINQQEDKNTDADISF